MPLTLPTILTLFRIAMLPVMVVVFYAPFRGANIAASGVFIAAALTDWLDGWVARRYGLTSAFGAFLDPVADKLMVAVTLFLIVQDNPTVPLAVISAIIVGRGSSPRPRPSQSTIMPGRAACPMDFELPNAQGSVFPEFKGAVARPTLRRRVLPAVE